MRNRFAQAVNRWIGEHMVAAASSPNSEGDPKGLVSRLFLVSFYAGKARRRFKNWNPTVYRLTKLALLAGVVALFVWW